VTTEILIFCDGGLGNRMNALFSGVAIAKTLDLPFSVGWPENTWCRASFTDVFHYDAHVRNDLLSSYKARADEYFCFTHDKISADSFGAEFRSINGFRSIDEFSETIRKAGKPIFYYPALVPQWLEDKAVDEAAVLINIREDLKAKARQFIFNELAWHPYYGIHLRRTDLNTGYSDSEVDEIVGLHETSLFFVCSDSERAELRAACNPNVRIRRKTHHVSRQDSGKTWQDLAPDSDGRLYFSNIDRGREAVLEAVIDMLILGAGYVIEAGGSTFRKMAERLARCQPLLELGMPPKLTYPAVSDCVAAVRRVENRSELALKMAQSFEQAKRLRAAVSILKAALMGCAVPARILIMSEIGRLETALNNYPDAQAWYGAALQLDPKNEVIISNLSYIESLLKS
jgi:hypothetical protein